MSRHVDDTFHHRRQRMIYITLVVVAVLAFIAYASLPTREKLSNVLEVKVTVNGGTYYVVDYRGTGRREFARSDNQLYIGQGVYCEWIKNPNNPSAARVYLSCN
jgi:hypothetical protein